MYASIALLALTACGNKEAPVEAAGEPIAAIPSNIPEDAMSQAYAEKLLDLTLRNFKPSDALGGAVLTETVFRWPGMGTYIVDSLENRDYMAIQGAVLTLAATFVLVNLLVDVLYAFIDPRIRYG